MILLIKTVLGILPIVLAMIAIILAGLCYEHARRKTDKVRLILSCVCSILLILAQSSWFFTAVLAEDYQKTTITDAIWTVFNGLVMILIIITVFPRKNHAEPPAT